MKLIFVYNANSGKLNLYKDIAHKILSPGTYPCSLCAVTHGVFNEKEVWKDFRETGNFDMHFYHTDEFLKAYQSKWLQKFDFPVILEENQNELSVFISKEELDRIENAQKLIALIEEKQEISKQLSPRAD